jgi:alpha-1,6-mannosyltransferase
MHVVDTTMFFCARSGGVKRYLLAKRQWLARHVPSIRHTLLVPAPQARSLNVQMVNSWALRLRDGYRLPLRASDWRRSLEALDPDLIEASDPYIPAWAARQAAHRLGIPAVAFYHSDMARMLTTRVGQWMGPVARAYLRTLYAGFDLVLAPSRLMHQQLLEVGIQHVRLQPLGVDVDTFAPDRADGRLRTALGLASDTRLLVYAGRFAAEKNIPLLVAAAARLGSGYHLLMIGGRARERITPNVTVVPYQRDADRLARLLASCDVFLHAGDSETYGLVAVEAMACGLPVVATARGALAELVDDAVGVLAERATVDGLVDAVIALCDQELVLIGRQARERAVNRHAWDAVFPRLLTHYATVSSRTDVPLPHALKTGAEG